MPGPRKWRHRHRQHFERWTVPREAILDLMKRTSKHMSAKDIYAALYKMYPGIGLTTVYRTLDLLVRMGLINKFAFGDGQNRYEFKSEEKKGHHHHVICSNCGKIINYSDFLEDELELVRKTENRLSEKYNFKVLGHNIEFYGLCDRCR
jgi:Fur family ferric uptake transcriptional regulator